MAVRAWRSNIFPPMPSEESESKMDMARAQKIWEQMGNYRMGKYVNQEREKKGEKPLELDENFLPIKEKPDSIALWVIAFGVIAILMAAHERGSFEPIGIFASCLVNFAVSGIFWIIYARLAKPKKLRSFITFAMMSILMFFIMFSEKN